MNVAASASRQPSPRFFLICVLVALALALVWFVGHKNHYFTDYSLASYCEYYWPRRLGLIAHLSGGVLIGSLGGFYLALTIPEHLAYSTGLFMLCIAWVLTTGMALYASHGRRVERHREWMLRSYTVTFAFVSFRLASAVLSGWIQVPDDPVASELDTLLAWACWSVPLLFAEPLIQFRSIRRSTQAATPISTN
jgi:hypothetical protein